MKKSFLLLLLLGGVLALQAQVKPFRFAFVTDTHIGSPSGSAEEDLRRTVRDINSRTDLDFVVITGDITELGTNAQLPRAKAILDELHLPYHIIPGNHDACWSESGGVEFLKVFGYDKFVFDHNGIRFIACASGPYVRMSDGHIPRDAIVWLDSVLANTSATQPVIFLNHYPVDNSLDNWYELTNRLHHYNTQAILCGHGHRNRAMDFEAIPGTMGRSNLRAKDSVGGYNLVTVTKDSILFEERRPQVVTLPEWRSIAVTAHHYDTAADYERPSYAVNDTFSQVKATWSYADDANVISTPGVTKNRVIFGNQNGKITALSFKAGKPVWTYQTGGGVFSSPAISGNRVVVGSGDGFVYCLDVRSGALLWKLHTGAAVLGSPLIDQQVVYIGGSDHHFQAIDLASGKIKWSFEGLKGPVVSKPLLYEGKLIFGAWDGNLYALDQETGRLVWSWNNGSPIANYSPAACIPVAHNGVVYIVAPDRYITALDAATGEALWRNNDATVRESVGIAANGDWVYGKTMNDYVVAYKTSRQQQSVAWKLNVGFGYEHAPSMLIEEDGLVFLGTRNGVVYAIDPVKQVVVWAHKIDNSMVNTVQVVDKHHVVVATMDGKVNLLTVRQ